MTSEAAPAARFQGLLRSAGFVLILLLVFVVPLGFFPIPLRINTLTSEIVVAKHVYLRVLCSLVVLVAAPLLLSGGSILLDYWRRGRLFIILIALNLLALLTAALFSPAPQFSLERISSPAAMLVVAGLAPLFITSPRQVRAVLYAAVASALAAALIGLLTRAGFGGFMRLIYGENPFDVDILETGGFGTGPEGGARRGPLMSTLGNVEFAGNFFAGGFLLAGCWLLDGWGGRRHRRLGWWIGGAAVAAILAFAMVMTATRGVVVMSAAGLTSRWLAGGPVRGLALAAGLALTVMAGVLAGLAVAMGTAGVLLAGALVYEVRRGGIRGRWMGLPARTRWLMIAGFAGVALLTASAAVPGPWQNRTFFLFERLFESTSTADRSIRERLTFYMISAEMLLQNPLFGIGPGLYPAGFHEYGYRLVASDPSGAMAWNQMLLRTYTAQEAHNDYFHVAAERGLVGLAALVTLFTVAVGGLARVGRARAGEWSGAALAVLTGLAGYLGNMLTSFPLFEVARMTTIHVLVALAGCVCVWAVKGVDAGPEQPDTSAAG